VFVINVWKVLAPNPFEESGKNKKFASKASLA
jgi:hypothetical protein